MDDLAAFLELVHTSGSRWRSLSATVEMTMDLSVARSSMGAVLGRLNLPTPPPMPPGDAVAQAEEARTFHLLADGTERVRIEQTGAQHTLAVMRPDGTATQSPAGEWAFQPAQGAGDQFPPRFMVGGPRGGAQAFGLVSMVDPSVLLACCRFSSATKADSNGRAALHSIGTVTKKAFGIVSSPADLHPGCTAVEVTVDVATGVLLRLDEITADGPLCTRSLRIVAMDEPVDSAAFALPADVEATKDARSVDRFDSPKHLAANVEGSVYELQPAPPGGMVLCMRHSISSARISYMPALGSASGSGPQFAQPTVVRSEPASATFAPGDGWGRAEVQGRSAWVWTATNGDRTTSHVRISFADASVELVCERDQAEALLLAATLRRVEVP